ncbi:GNAT family N-acetyltransferase [Aestuariispira insulae]|uniref:Acetyltransferase (GNAT) family protein n=1 Tax=Aestuariispira insulae TaxID=1461337 RepID=A0A3D9HSP0_9PROT|nr:GNAT family N-acetyltransferase [Aestuariispira insulae]RED52523.1 acetyltransferase (GNAT) family protein [Aestuariispira insulae]
MSYEIGIASREEVDRMVEWAAREGWNPGLADADAFFAADDQGFLAGRLDGRMIASISAVRYGDRFGFIGFYIVDPDFRGFGYGYRLWQAAIDYLGDRVIGLDGVVDQQDNYAQSGFRLEQNNIRFGGEVTVSAPTEADILPLDYADPAITAYDSAFFAGPRAAFLAAWIKHPKVTAHALKDGDRLLGFGAIRPCREGFKIGPLFAENSAAADQLFRSLCALHPGEQVYLDVPQPNGAAMALAQRYGLEPCFETARMYKGGMPDLPWDHTFGITSFELG